MVGAQVGAWENPPPPRVPQVRAPARCQSSAVSPPFSVSAIAGRLQFPLHVASLPKASAQVALAQFLRLSGQERKTPAEHSMGRFPPTSVRPVVGTVAERREGRAVQLALFCS